MMMIVSEAERLVSVLNEKHVAALARVGALTRPAVGALARVMAGGAVTPDSAVAVLMAQVEATELGAALEEARCKLEADRAMLAESEHAERLARAKVVAREVGKEAADVRAATNALIEVVHRHAAAVGGLAHLTGIEHLGAIAPNMALAVLRALWGATLPGWPAHALGGHVASADCDLAAVGRDEMRDVLAMTTLARSSAPSVDGIPTSAGGWRAVSDVEKAEMERLRGSDDPGLLTRFLRRLTGEAS